KLTKTTNTIKVDLGADIATLDPQLVEDSQSFRVAVDLFEGLVSFNQNNQPIPGLAQNWEISPDGKTYIFHLRPNLKFSDGSSLSVNDVVFSFQRLADPKLNSPYNYLVNNIENGSQIIAGKLPITKLGIKAINPQTIQINLVHPDNSFLKICALPELAIVSQANINKFANQWTDTKNIVGSGAYKLDERIVQGTITISKNPYYYDANNVKVNQIKFYPIVDRNSALNQYKTDQIDITSFLPIDQYQTIKQTMANQEHTVAWEAVEFLDFNLLSAKLKNNLKLRQALSMAVDRETLVKQVLGQDQTALYSYTTKTIESGKFANLDYPWANWTRDKQIAEAQLLFKQAGYSQQHPLEISISYNTRDDHRKKALAIASMWQQVFGKDAIKINLINQEWKVFLQARRNGDFELARDGYAADYNSVDGYTSLFLCNNPQNRTHYCNQHYDELINQAQNTQDPTQRINLIHQALSLIMNDYSVIPLFQTTYYRLIKPQIKGYTPETNHLDHVMSKWYKF
ncbi:MAG: hypothetical protein RLZZ293_266, partial [Pseudomonadota bacterium]